MPKKDEYVTFKNYERKIKSPFIIYANFQSILSPENNGKQNPDESYTNKYQKYVACSYGYKLVCVDDNIIKSVKSLRKKCSLEFHYWYDCSDVMKKHFNKELVITMKILRSL